MKPIVTLAVQLRIASSSLAMSEAKEQRLSELASSGRWENLYSEQEFKDLCKANQEELKVGSLEVRKIDQHLSRAALEAARGDERLAASIIQEAKELEQAAYDKEFLGTSARHSQEEPSEKERVAELRESRRPGNAPSLVPEHAAKLEAQHAALSRGQDVKQAHERPAERSQSPLTPEQKLRRQDMANKIAAAKAPDEKGMYVKGLPPAQRGLPEERASRDDIDRWFSPARPDDLDGPGGR